MADAQEEERTQQFSTPPATLQCRTDKLMQESLSNRQRPERGGGEGCLLMDLPCTEMDEIFFFFFGNKYFSSATTVPATTTTSADTMPLLVVEAGTGVAEGPGSTCTICQDSCGDHSGRAGKYEWVFSV